MEIGHRPLRSTVPRLTSTLFSKPQTDTEGSPRHQRQNIGNSWVANLQNITTPRTTNRQIMDFDRLMSLSAVEKVGSVPVLESRVFQHKRPLTDRDTHNYNTSQQELIRRLYSPQRPINQMEQSESRKCCCNLFQRKVPKPSSKVIQPPKKMKRPNLNQLVVEKRKIKIVTSREFNQRRKITISEDKVFQTPTNLSSFETYRLF